MSESLNLNHEQTPQKKPVAQAKRTAVSKAKRSCGFISKNIFTICAVAFIIMAAICVFLYHGTVQVGAEALKQQYHTAYDNEKDSTYQSFRESASNWAKKHYHVSSEVEISIGELEEVTNLEVLDAFATAHIIQNRDKSTGNVTMWLKVNGRGTFIVNLQAAEYIVDNTRQHVSVRIPYPELTDIHEVSRKVDLFEDDFWNGSFKDGVDMVIAEGEKGMLQIEKALITNQEIYENAKKAAQSIVTNLVKQFNPNVSDLTVDVTFFELGQS